MRQASSYDSSIRAASLSHSEFLGRYPNTEPACIDFEYKDIAEAR
jgi:hypothetical protein